MKTSYLINNGVRQIRLLIIAILTVICTDSVWGSAVTFHYTSDKGATQLSVTKSDVTVSVGAGDMKATEGYYKANASSTLKVSTTTSANIKKFVIHCVNATYASNLSLKAGESGTLTIKGDEVYWEGSSKSITMNTKTGGQVRFNAVRVVLDDGQCSLLVWNNSKGMYEVWQTISSSTSLPYSSVPENCSDATFSNAWSQVEFSISSYPNNASGYYSKLLWSSNSPTAGSNLELYALYTWYNESDFTNYYTTRPCDDYKTWITITIAATPLADGTATTSSGETLVSIAEGDILELKAVNNPGYVLDFWYYDRDNSDYEFDDEFAYEPLFTINNAYGYLTGTIRARFVESVCSSPTVTFANNGPYAKNINDTGFTNAATSKYSGSNTGQTITYSSSNSTIASVNPTTGAVTIGSTAGTVRITATATATATYCEASASYTINVSAVAPTLSHNTTGKELTVSSITSGGVTVSGGIITDKGGAAITQYGFVIGTSAGVTYETASKKGGWTGDKSLNSAFGSGSYTGLSPNTTYYVRAFAYNGTAYGYSTAISFKTLQSYTITHNKNDGSGTTSTQNIDAGGSITVGGALDWSRTGYSLDNWRLNNASTGTVYANGVTYGSISANATFYAQWTANTYSVRFNRNGGTGGANMSNQNFTYNVAQNLTTNTYSRTGYDFAGWATSENGAVEYDDAENVSNLSTTNGAVVDLYARWTAHETSLTLDKNDGDADGSATVVYDATGLKDGTLSHASYAGHTLEGYYAEAGHTTKVLNSDGSFAATNVSGYITSGKWTRDAATTLYAFWAANPQSVTFNLDGKGDNFVRVVDNGTKVTRPADPTHVDYNFDDWYTDDGTGHASNTKYNFNNNVIADITVYAKWTAKTYQHLIFACVDIALDTEDTNPILVTSRNGVNVMATKKLSLTVSGALPGHRVTLTGTDLKFYRKTTVDPIRYVEATGANSFVAPLTEEEIYVSYNPPATPVGTGAVVTPNITVACDGFEETFSGKVKARNLPDAVTIVAKVGNTWQAVPANMATEATPAPIMVSASEAGGILTAYGPSTVQYKLWPVATVSGASDRFGTGNASDAPTAFNGDRLRFAGNSNKGLWANNSTSENGIKNFAAITAIGTNPDNAAAYEWVVTTTEVDGQFVYTLQTDQSNNTNYLRLWGSKWGTYADANGTAEVYILPLVPTETADITVMEWGVDQIAVKYANAGNVASGTFKAKIGTGSQTAVTSTSLGGDIYKLTGVGNLQNNPAKTLVLNMTETSTPKQAVFAIPLIVTAEKTEAELSSYAAGGNGTTLMTEGRTIAKGLDVVIRNGGKLTTGTASGKFANLYIYPGGKADISENIGLSNIYLRGGLSWLDAAKDFRLPQMKVDEDLSISGIKSSGNGVYYDLYADYEMYYMIALPRDVMLTSVTNEENADVFKAKVKWYDGSKRAGSNPLANCWISPGAKLERGKGYEIAVQPRNGRTIGILRFPLLTNTEWSNESDCKPKVTAHGMTISGDTYTLNEGVTANNAGWNLMGNPFFTSFTTGTDGLIIDSLTKHIDNGVWDGTYDWFDEQVKYYTIPNKLNYEYKDVRSSGYELEPFYPFFIQAKINGTLSFLSTNRTLAPARLRNSVRETMLDFLLENEDGNTDVTGFNISDKYSDNFDMDDKEKTIEGGNNFMKVYTIMNGYRIAFNSVTEESAEQKIPVGYIAPKAGSYIFTLSPNTNIADIEAILLTDYQEGITTDLLYSDYEFTTAAGQFDKRFALNVILRAPQIYTDIEDTGSGSLDLRVYSEDGHITIVGALNNAQIYVYDMSGKLVSRQQSAVSNQISRMRISVPAGVYNVRVVSSEGNATVKTIVR